MSYFAGSLLNPKIPGGRDNRSRSAFDQYFPDMGQPVSPQAQMSMPRNEATLQTPCQLFLILLQPFGHLLNLLNQNHT